MDIRRLGPGDEDDLRLVEPCFDHPVQAGASTRFLTSPDHHILVAYEDGVVAGFVSGVETTHPDKGTEMLLYELDVRQHFRRRGIGTALVRALTDVARGRGCYGMWALADADNEAAIAAYRASGASRDCQPVMLSWNLDDDHAGLHPLPGSVLR